MVAIKTTFGCPHCGEEIGLELLAKIHRFWAIEKVVVTEDVEPEFIEEEALEKTKEFFGLNQ